MDMKILELNFEYSSYLLEKDYAETLSQVVMELENMTDSEARKSVELIIDYLENHQRVLHKFKLNLRDYISSRKNDTEIIRAICKKWIM